MWQGLNTFLLEVLDIHKRAYLFLQYYLNLYLQKRKVVKL